MKIHVKTVDIKFVAGEETIAGVVKRNMHHSLQECSHGDKTVYFIDDVPSSRTQCNDFYKKYRGYHNFTSTIAESDLELSMVTKLLMKDYNEYVDYIDDGDKWKKVSKRNDVIKRKVQELESLVD